MKRAASVRIVLALGLGLALAAVCLLFGSRSALSQPQANELHVCPIGCLYSSVQAAVDAASEGDTIKVATGVYTDINTLGGSSQIVYISKTVTVEGGYTTTNWSTSHPITQPTTLNAQGQGRVMYITGNISPTIVGLQLTGGGGYDIGGGGGVCIISARATFSNNEVFNNTAWTGGGVALLNSASLLISNNIHDNQADSGGGVYLSNSDATLTGNIVSNNTAPGPFSLGGGLYLYNSAATLDNNSISGNYAANTGGGLHLDSSNATLSHNAISGNSADSEGGGLYLDSSNATLSHNAISSNSTDAGGGLYLINSPATLDGNIIASNHATYVGGGLVLATSQATLTNDVVMGNASGGVFVSASLPRILFTSFAGNSNTGIYITDASDTPLTMTNTILVNHDVGLHIDSPGTVLLDGVLWSGNATADTAGDGNIVITHAITGNPVFAPDGYHLTACSAAIDAGVVSDVTTDIDGDVRPQRSGYDLGADEYGGGLECRRTYLPLALHQSP